MRRDSSIAEVDGETCRNRGNSNMTDESRARLIRRLNHVRWIAVFSFFLGIAILAIAASFAQSKRPDFFWGIASGVVSGFLLMLISPVVLICAIVARDVVAGKGKWQFSLRDLLILLTAIALALGMLVISMRN